MSSPAHLGAALLLLLVGCSDRDGGSRITVDAAGVSTDATLAGEDAAAELRLDTALCPSLTEAFAVLDAPCEPTPAATCEQQDAPTFVELDGTRDLCSVALAAPDGTAQIAFDNPRVLDATCEGATFISPLGDGAFRVSFAGNRTVADLLANSQYLGLSAEARIGTSGCSRRLRLAGSEGGRAEIIDLPPEGAVIAMPIPGRLEGTLTLRPMGEPCTPSAGVCFSGDGLWGDVAKELFVPPCGIGGFPVGGCGDALGWAIIGTSECGGRIHAAFFSPGRVRICH